MKVILEDNKKRQVKWNLWYLAWAVWWRMFLIVFAATLLFNIVTGGRFVTGRMPQPKNPIIMENL